MPGIISRIHNGQFHLVSSSDNIIFTEEKFSQWPCLSIAVKCTVLWTSLLSCRNSVNIWLLVIKFWIHYIVCKHDYSLLIKRIITLSDRMPIIMNFAISPESAGLKRVYLDLNFLQQRFTGKYSFYSYIAQYVFRNVNILAVTLKERILGTGELTQDLPFYWFLEQW